jgi:predicted glycoside hydrolase/deacetylase ChbG (UPF0249 family)
VRRLVVNADDFGLHPAIDAGILEAKRRGILTSATVLVTGMSASAAISSGKREGLSMGLHLALCGKLPCAASSDSVRSLAPRGRLPSAWPDIVKGVLFKRISAADIETELRAQIQLAIEMGLVFDHFDSHQHVHMMPTVSDIVSELAREHDVPVRWPAAHLRRPSLLSISGTAKAAILAATSKLQGPPKYLRTLPVVGLSASGRLTLPALLTVLRQLPEGDFELMCHPGFTPDVVTEDPAWRSAWRDELDALTSAEVRKTLAALNIELTSYGALFEPSLPIRASNS